MNKILDISANFRTGATLPSIEEQYIDLWEMAKFLDTLGIAITEWFPPADTEANSLLNSAFTETGPSPAAIAMAKADKDNLAHDLRTLGVWNGKEDEGGMVYTTTYNTGSIPSFLSFNAEEAKPLLDYRNLINLLQFIVGKWNPMLIQVTPDEYGDLSIFKDRPGAGWMLYLPFTINGQQLPEAAEIIPVMDEKGKKQRGSLIVTVTEIFDTKNREHVKRANAVETRLVDQDLLPRMSDFVGKF
jgi:hypothetical protein